MLWEWERDYIYRDGQLLPSVEPDDMAGEATSHFHLDHLGSPQQITDGGAVETAFHTYLSVRQRELRLKFTGHERAPLQRGSRMKIRCVDLRRIAEVLLGHLEEVGQDEFEIDKDFYWEVPSSNRYDQYDEPVDLTAGQLSDDWSELEGILSGAKEPIGYGLVWLASILRVLGEDAKG